MLQQMELWLVFLFLAMMIGLAGPALSRNGDIIAHKLELSGSWIGVVLIATVTSLPELITGVSAVTIWDLPDIAVGTALGSCVFNLAILIVLDFLVREEPIYRRANSGHIVSAGFGVMLIGFAGSSILMSAGGMSFAIWHVSLATPALFVVYAMGMRTVYHYERDHREELSEEIVRQYPSITLRMALRRYGFAAIIIAAAGVSLPSISADLAAVMGWNRTFVGTLLVAAVTSLPELVVTVAAMRLGALNMAIAGLLGSNLFDIAIIAVEDLIYLKGPLMAVVSPTHAVSAFSAVVMTGVAIVGLQYRSRARLFGTVSWASLALFTVYLLNSYVLFLHGH
jgi:cation:H+ antiporter